MNKTIMFLGMLAVGFANAQQTNNYDGKVGVNTNVPQATLEVQPTVTNLADTTNEGIIAPKLSKTRVAAIATPVEGTLVYVTNEAESLITAYTGNDTKVAKIDEKGYYYFDGTEWVKTSNEWIRNTKDDIDKIYMKNVLAGDEISYRRDKGYYGINLGGLTQTDIGSPLDESPVSTFVGSSKLPTTSNNNRFYFNKNISILDNTHANVNGREYVGNLYKLETKNITSQQEEIKTLDISLQHTGTGKAKFQTALSVSNTVNGTNTKSIGGKVYGITATARTIADANVDKLVGIWSYVNNIVPSVGKAKITQMSGMEVEVNSSHPGNTGKYTEAELGTLYGYKADITNTPNSKTDGIKGVQTILTFQKNSEIKGRAAGVDAYALIDRDANIKEYSSIVSNIDNISGAATIGSLHGMRLYNNIHTDSKIENMYGIKIESISKGKNNYSIFTDAGKVRLGDLANTSATGDRAVYVDADGVLKVGATTTSTGATQLSGTDGIECNKDNRGKMNFKTNDNGSDVFGICMRNKDGNYYWAYMVGGNNPTNGTGTFGSGL